MASPSSIIDPARRPPHCAAAPLLWSLLPLVGGILLAKVPHGGLIVGTAASVIALIGLLSFRCTGIRAADRTEPVPPPSKPNRPWRDRLCPVRIPKPWRDRLRPVRVPKSWRDRLCPVRRRLPILLASLLAGHFLAHRAAPGPDPLWQHLPPREVRLTLSVEERFNARKPGHIAGVARILRSDIPHDTLRNARVAFYLESGALAGSRPSLEQSLESRGVLTYLPALEEVNDYHLYLRGRDIYLSLGQGVVLREARPPPPLEILRERLYRRCERVLASGSQAPEDAGNVIASMLLGSRSLLTDERIALYRRTGTYHLFAVSGLHVGSIALCLHLLAALVRIPAIWRFLPTLSGTWIYVWLTGASPSAVRAGIMISCVALARLLLRQPHLFPALVLSAWLVLLLDPGQLFQLGFQLSYSVVASILLVGLPLARHLRQHFGLAGMPRDPQPRWQHRLRKAAAWGLDLSSVSASASLGSLPLIIQHFSLFTPGGFLFGMLLNPLASLTVMSGCVAMLAGFSPLPLLGEWVARGLWPVIAVMESALALCLRIPGAVSARNWAWPPFGTLLLLGMLLLAWSLQRLRQGGTTLPALLYLAPHALVLAGLALTSVNT